MTKYLDKFPQPLLDDIVKGRVLPFIGAGFSLNAEMPKGEKMPAWDDLGKRIAKSLPSYEYVNALDALTAYAHEFSRGKLIEKLFDELYIHTARPGIAHKAFCNLKFDIVCTTNFDFLLEHGYREIPVPCRPIINEDQLSLDTSTPAVRLIKLHGDLDHPNRLVVTEDDYDAFLYRFPLIATYLANLLISKTPLFIGYSLDDPDLRSIWYIIKERLGALSHPGYTIRVNESAHVISRFDRRGVKVINLQGAAKDYSKILTQVFDELNEYLKANILTVSTVTKEEPLAELSLPKDATSRLCFFTVPQHLVSFYKSYIFPIATKQGFTPITADDVLSPGDSILAKIAALYERAEAVVWDIASDTSRFANMGWVLSRQSGSKSILFVVEQGTSIPAALNEVQILVRQRDPFDDPEPFLASAEQWFANLSASLKQTLEDEPRRLLRKSEYRAAVISAFTLLENEILGFLKRRGVDTKPNIYAMNVMLSLMREQQALEPSIYAQIKDWMKFRNKAVHTNEPISGNVARSIVNGIYSVVESLRNIP